MSTETKQMFRTEIRRRYTRGTIFKTIFILSTMIGIVALSALLITILNSTFGYVALQYETDPMTLSENGVPLEDLPKTSLVRILENHVSKGLMRRWEFEKPLNERSREDVYGLVLERVVNLQVVESWSLFESLFRKKEIVSYTREKYPGAILKYRSWISLEFLKTPQSSVPEKAGVRSALFGSLWMILITVVFAFPLGVGTAIYLEEYAGENRFTRIIQVNIYNLAGVPSIIYGILGLAVFVRMLEPLTSGSMFGVSESSIANGRTILSAGLTLGLLVLPLIIINSQEAIRAVPASIRYSSVALGATKWQTIWHHVLPSSLDRILTGTILAVSRAIGETAPLVVVGASTFVSLDPTSVFSKFTALPIQIYQWTARPQAEFRHVAAAAIIVLLVLLLTLNTAAVLIRNRISKRRREE